MKNTILTLTLLPMFSAITAICQPPQRAQVGQGTRSPVEIDKTPPVEDFKPSALNAVVNGQIKPYPQVNSQGRMRTTLKAPNAQSVMLDIGGVRYPMTKGDDGVWTGVSNAQDEGFHYYQLRVDDIPVPDPGTLMFYGASRWGSGIEVPAHTWNSMPSRMCRTAICGKFTFSPSSPTPLCNATSTRHPVMRRDRSATQCSICSTAPEKTNMVGASKGTRA